MYTNSNVTNTLDFNNLSSLAAMSIDLMVLIIVLLYIVFSLIVVRQVYLMSNVVITGGNKYIKFFAWLQLAFSFIFAYFILSLFVIQ